MPVPSADSTNSDSKPALLPPPPPLMGFSADEFRARRSALRASCPQGILLLRGAVEDEAVSPGRYQQNSNFTYFTGVETPGGTLVMLPDGLSPALGVRGAAPDVREILFLPARSATGETWTGPKLGPGSETEACTGIQKTADATSLTGSLLSWLRYNPMLFMPVPFGDSARFTRDHSLIQHLQSQAPTLQLRDATLAISRLRMIKSPAEVERIEEAIRITHAGQRAALRLIAGGAGRNECEVEAAIYEAFRSRGATLAFGTIVGGGVNGTVLHYEHNHDVLQEGDLVVVDIGARTAGYCGDITRTYPVGGRFGEREREIYNLVKQAYNHSISGFRPGDTLLNLTDRCKAFLKELPQRSKGTAGIDQTLDNFMPHGLSHHLGLDVHDVGDREAMLTPGCVITIEPGLYLPAEKIGVRIEDDYLVTENGLQRLGPPLESEAGDVEQAMQALA